MANNEGVKADSENPEPQIFIEHFSMEELHYTLKRNNGRIIGLYDDISLLYEQLDKYKNGSADRETMLSLINGSTSHVLTSQDSYNRMFLSAFLMVTSRTDSATDKSSSAHLRKMMTAQNTHFPEMHTRNS